MNRLQKSVQSVRTFTGDVGIEMRKSSWPTRQELVSSTLVVIVSVAMLAAFVGISDRVLVSLLRLLIPTGR